MKFNLIYIDLGVHRGQEIQMLLEEIGERSDIEKISIYGVEANPELFEQVRRRFKDNAGRLRAMPVG